VLRLTGRYLEARFGHEPFTPEERRDFLRDVRDLMRQPRDARAA